MQHVGRPKARKIKTVCAGEGIQRKDLGLPSSWEEIEAWIDDSRDIAVAAPSARQEWTKKNPEIPVLRSYETPPPPKFLGSFSNQLSDRPKTVSESLHAKKIY